MTRIKIKKPREKKNETPEHDIQAAFIHWCRMEALLGRRELAYFYSIPNGIFVSKFTRNKMVAEGLLMGVSDLHLPVPRGSYHGLFLEVKNGTQGKISIPQRNFIAFVTSQGYFAKVCGSLEELKETVDWYMNVGGNNVSKNEDHQA